MRHLVSGIAAVALLFAAALPASTSAAAAKTCASVSTPTGLTSKVTVKGTTCTTGRAVAKRFATKGTSLSGWRCNATPTGSGAKVLCKKKTGSATVKFQVAD